MRNFATLIDQLDQAAQNDRKSLLLQDYLQHAPDADKLWTIALLSGMDGRCPRRIVTLAQLREWAMGESTLPEWLFDESYRIAGDPADAMALLTASSVNENRPASLSLAAWMQHLMALKPKTTAEKKEFVINAWQQMNNREKYIFNKLVTGGFRPPLDCQTLVHALSKLTGQEEKWWMHRVISNWKPLSITYEALTYFDEASSRYFLPYSFCDGHQNSGNNWTLPMDTDLEEWVVEWKWDGIRCQLIRRNGEVFIWSADAHLHTRLFPSVAECGLQMADGTVIDGELIPYDLEAPLPFTKLVSRMRRKWVTNKLQADIPVVLMAFDLLEVDGQDIRSQPLAERRAQLQALLSRREYSHVLISPEVSASSWEILEQQLSNCRKHGTQGMVMKQRKSLYDDATPTMAWCYLQPAPLSVLAVLLYSAPSRSQDPKASSEYSFALWKDDKLITLTRTNLGLPKEEIAELDIYIKQNTVERFGPVRSVRPELVFEIEFDAISTSSRSKSGLDLRSPRIRRWAREKQATEAHQLSDLQQWLQ